MLLHTSASTSVSYSHNAYHSHSQDLRPCAAWLRFKQTAHNSTTFEPKQSVITHYIHPPTIHLLKMTNTFKFQNITERFFTKVTKHRTWMSFLCRFSVPRYGQHLQLYQDYFFPRPCPSVLHILILPFDAEEIENT
jgi:hypothetical protein